MANTLNLAESSKSCLYPAGQGPHTKLPGVLIQATGGLLNRKGYIVVRSVDTGKRRTPEQERIHGYWNC